MKTRIARLMLVAACGLLLSGCSRITEMNAVVAYRPGIAREEIEALTPDQIRKSQQFSAADFLTLLSLMGDNVGFYLGLGWISIQNPTQRDWAGVGVILTSPNLKHDVEAYVGMVQREGLRKTAQMFYSAPVEFRYLCPGNIRAGETILVHLMRFSPAVTASRMVAVSQDPSTEPDPLSALLGAFANDPRLERLQTQLVKDITASRAVARVVVGLGESSSQKSDFLTDNTVGSKKQVVLPIAHEQLPE